MSENTCEIRVGRLLEIRLAKGYETDNDVEQMIQMIRASVSTLPEDVRHVTIADWRQCKVLTKATAARAIEMMRGTNPRTERSVLLHDQDSATLVMQVIRLVREANHPDRRVFHEPEAALSWVSEVLSPKESQRAREFLTSG